MSCTFSEMTPPPSPRVTMRSVTALRDWCRDACAGYQNLQIEDLSSSFRDGLAFCAIIHKHRPELLDFSSLSRSDSYQNNQLAFETAEAKLGIPTLLHPKELVSSEAPDPLGVITYLSWYYCFFSGTSWAGLASSGSSRVTNAKRLPRRRVADGPKGEEDAARQEQRTGLIGQRSSSARVRAVCRLCLKPVHLIQRRLGGGKIYHRSCFRCGVCRCTLLPHWCTPRGDSGSLVCSHHPADSQMTEPELSAPPRSEAGGPTGAASLTSESVQPNDRLASETPDAEEQGGEEAGAAGEGQRSGDTSGSPNPPVVDADAQQEGVCQLPEVPCQTQEQASEPEPAPEAQGGASRSQAAERTPRECTCSARLSPSPSASVSSVRLNHPWLNIIHPGPWTQLPAAPPPAPSLRSRHRPRVAAPNPFEKAGTGATPQNAERLASERAGGGRGGSLAGAADAQAARVTPLPSTVSVLGPKASCRQVQCDQQPAPSRCQTLQTTSSVRAAAPGHGFPPVRRKVQTDRGHCPGGLQVEAADLDRRLELMERRGVELERNLRDCRDEEEEEEMLMEWITLNHDRHALVRRDMELGYLTMQQKLEERQADVEYELRRLLVKQENEWTEEERGEERRLMCELVSLVDQRNQIICSLDQDVQREREEDKLLEATLNRKGLRKSKGKLKPSKVFKLLQHRAATGTKEPPVERS